MWIRILSLFVTLSALCVVTIAEEARLRRVFDEACWKIYKDKTVRSAKVEEGIKSLVKCKNKCIGIERCKAVQWNSDKKECAIHLGKMPRWQRLTGVDQYYKERCHKKVKTIQLEDLTPSNKKNKVFYFEGFDGTEWYLDVQLNVMLFGRKTMFQKRTTHGKIVGRGSVPDDCFYIGTANGGEHEGGLAAVSNCEADMTRAYIQTPIQDYEINPFRKYADMTRSIRDPIEELKYLIMKRSELKTNSSVFSANDVTDHVLSANDVTDHPLNVTKTEFPKANASVDHPLKMSRREVGANTQLDRQEPIPPGYVIYLDLSSMVDVSFRDLFTSITPSTDDQMYLHIAQLYNFAQVWFLNPTLGFQVWLTMNKVILLQNPLVEFPDTSRKRQSYGLMNNCNYLEKVYKDSKWWDAVFILTESNFMTSEEDGLAIGSGACQADLHCAAVKAQSMDMAMLTRAIVHETSHLLGMPDVYPPMVASKFCFSGLMRSAQYNHDWSRCGNQAMTDYLYTKVSKCVTRPKAKLRKGVKRPRFMSNVLWRSRAKQSSTKNGNSAKFGAWKAVDGSFASMSRAETKANPVYASCTSTKKQNKPWIRVEVLPEYQGSPIDTIHILNRPERYSRLENFEVRIGNNRDHTKNPLCYKRSSSLRLRREGSMLVVHCEKVMSGKYISIQIMDDRSILTICEIFAFQNIKLRNFENPYKCADRLPETCTLTKEAGHCRGDYKPISIKKCPYTCGFCKREDWKYTPDKSKVKTGGPPKCGDHADYCDLIKKRGKCGSRSSIQLCPKTCGQCGKVKMPEED